MYTMLMSLRKNLHIHLVTIALVLPSYVLAALPSSLNNNIPTCAQSCLEAQLQKNFAACPDASDVDCLCSRYGLDGYTVGEDAYACLYSSDCSQAIKSNGTGLYSLCSGRTNAVTATHRTIIVTATPTSAATRSSETTLPTMATTTDSSPGSTTPPNLDMPSPSPKAVMTMGNISLTMAQIAGITIAAAAVLILSVGIATCLIFVKRNKRLHDMEDSKILLYPSPRPQGSQGSQFALVQPGKDPRGGMGGVGIIPFQRPPPPPPLETPLQQQQQYSQQQQQQYQQYQQQQQQYPQQQQLQLQQWPRYYPIMPDDIGVATTANDPLPVAKGTAAPAPTSSGALMPNPQYAQPPLEQQSTGIILPQPPAPAHTEPPSQSLAVQSSNRNNERSSKRNSKPNSKPNSINAAELRPTSAMTEFEEDSMSPFRANFGKIKAPTQFPFAGPQEVNPIPYFPPPPTTKPRPPTLSIVIPKFEATLPPPPPGPPPSLQRPPMQREPQAQQLSAPPSQQDLRNSSYSSAIASSQALRSESMAEASSISQSRAPSKSGRDSQASFTSFESLESDDDPTPPKEEDKRLSTVQESYSPASRIKYPKVPRAANQVVARSPNKQIHVSPEPSPGLTTKTLPRTNVGTGGPAVAHGIGNRLWKTEKSPQSKRPYPNWMDRQEEHWSWSSEQSFIAPKTPSRHQTPVHRGYDTTPSMGTISPPRTPGTSTPAGSTPGAPEPQWEMQTPQNMAIGMSSPYGPMPKLTPTRRGDELYLSVN